jgi:hypothetical protein
MVRTLALRTTVGTLAGLVAVAGLTLPARAVPAVTIAKAGTVVGWGTEASVPAQAPPTDLQGTAFSAVAAGAGFTVALTAAGKVVVFGSHGVPGTDIEQVPPALSGTTVSHIDASQNNAGAVTSDGRVVVWGQHSEPSEGDLGLDPTDVPAGLTGVTSLAIGAYSAGAVKSGGTVVTWGLNPNNEITPPPGLSGVTSLAATSNAYFALKTDGTVTAWGATTGNQLVLPTSLTTLGNVKAVSARSSGGLALLANGKLESWGQSATGSNAVPPGLADKTVVAIATQGNRNLVLDSGGTVWVWGVATPAALLTPPSSLTGAEIVQISTSSQHAVALVTKVREVTKPTIAGASAPGQTLTATPATFSASPTSVTGQWRADGVDIAGATAPTLDVTAARAGQRITYVSKAVKGSSETFESVSAPTAPFTVAATTAISAAGSTYGKGGIATVTVSNGAGLPVSGTVTLTGAGAPQTAAVTGGRATFSLASTASAGSYTLTASYSGSTQLSSSAAAARYSIAKAKTKRPAFRASKAPTSKKKGKATVTVSTGSGLAKATGKVTITLKGKSKKTIKTTLAGGKKSISLPKLKKGTYKVTVSYAGDKNYAAQKSSTYKLKIKK